ncbi:hypothetical protein V3C99_015074, partial [Haemonchus contortus]
EMAQIEELNEELENRIREADLVLGEVVRCRASLPAVLAGMKKEECRAKFIRAWEAPLNSTLPIGIDVGKIKNDVTSRVKETQDLTEAREQLERKLQQLKAEHDVSEERYRKTFELLRNDRYKPVDALPNDFIFPPISNK